MATPHHSTQSHGKQTGFGHALRVQMRVLGALVLREMRVRYGRSQLGYFWALMEPVAYVAIMTSLFSYIERPPPFGHSIALFFALGVIPFRLFSSISNQLTGAMDANRALLAYPIVRELDTVLARLILETMTGLTIFIIFMSALHIVEGVPGPAHPLRVLQGLSLIVLFGFGVGLTNAVILRRFPSWQNIFRIITAPLFFLSAVFYSLESLPTQARDLLTWNPLVHGIEMVRDGYYSHYRATGLDGDYLFACGLGLVFVGMFAERFYRLR